MDRIDDHGFSQLRLQNNELKLTDQNRIISLIMKAESVFIVKTLEITPDLPNYYEIPLDFVTPMNQSNEFVFVAYILKHYIDVPNKLKEFIDHEQYYVQDGKKSIIQEEYLYLYDVAKYLTKFESSKFMHGILEILQINNEESSLYTKYMGAKVQFLIRFNSMSGLACHLDKKCSNMADIFYNYVSNYLPLKDAVMLKQVARASHEKQKQEVSIEVHNPIETANKPKKLQSFI
jgi:hypothetical protein